MARYRPGRDGYVKGGQYVRTEARVGHLPRGRSGLLRQAGFASTCGRDVALGARGGGGHLGRVLRLELRPRDRRLRRPPHRRRGHGGHVLRARLLDRRDVSGPPPHRRRLFVRALGDGAVGWLPHRARREHGVRDHAGRGRRRDGSVVAADHGGPVRGRRDLRRRRLAGRYRVVEQLAVLVGRVLRDLRRYQHHRDRGDDEVHRRHHGAFPRRARLLLHRLAPLRRLRHEQLDEHPRRRRGGTRGRRRPDAPVRDREASSKRSRSRSGSSWRSKRSHSRPRNRWILDATFPEARSSRCTRW